MNTKVANIAPSNERENWRGVEFMRFKSRINRVKHFGLFSFWLAIFVSTLLIMSECPLLFSSLYSEVIIVVIFILSVINLLFLKIRRFHDFDFKGWWIFATLIPLVGIIFTLSIFLMPGTAGANRFGDQPKAASNRYALMGLILPAFLAIVLAINYLGISAKFENWQTYNSKYFSIQFPGPYKVTEKTVYDVQFQDLEYTTKELILRVDRIDYKRASQNGINNSLSDSLKTPAAEFIGKDLMNDVNSKNIQILSDKSILGSPVNKRLIHAKFPIDGNTTYVKSVIYINEIEHFYYVISAYSLNENLTGKTVHVVDYFLNSFKLYAS